MDIELSESNRRRIRELRLREFGKETNTELSESNSRALEEVGKKLTKFLKENGQMIIESGVLEAALFGEIPKEDGSQGLYGYKFDI